MSFTSRLKKIFGFGTAKEQRDATDAALRWGFLVSLLTTMVFIPYPLNLLVLGVVLLWLSGWARHNFDSFNKLWLVVRGAIRKVWNVVTLKRWR